jgi:hypothetical protein
MSEIVFNKVVAAIQKAYPKIEDRFEEFPITTKTDEEHIGTILNGPKYVFQVYSAGSKNVAVLEEGSDKQLIVAI